MLMVCPLGCLDDIDMSVVGVEVDVVSERFLFAACVRPQICPLDQNDHLCLHGEPGSTGAWARGLGLQFVLCTGRSVSTPKRGSSPPKHSLEANPLDNVNRGVAASSPGAVILVPCFA